MRSWYIVLFLFFDWNFLGDDPVVFGYQGADVFVKILYNRRENGVIDVSCYVGEVEFEADLPLDLGMLVSLFLLSFNEVFL